ncbi:hypothetical protein [Pseudoalteromonas denitrificans]|nr:hypothetical protein [Pseudoalteromonas denitrificans]
MNINCAQVFEKLMLLYGCDNPAQISIKFDKNRAWSGQMIKKNSIPYPQCVQACEEKNVSMDWLLFDIGEKGTPTTVNRSELINNLKESFYECWELDLLPDYQTEIMPAIASLFAKNLEDLVEISKDKKIIKDKKVI